MSFTPVRVLAACSIVIGLSANSHAEEHQSCKSLRVGAVTWTDVIATTSLTKALLERLGYKADVTNASQQIIYAGIRDQRLDFFLGYWNPLMTANITPFIQANHIKVLEQPSLSDARATLAVPDYLYDKGLKTFADIARFKSELKGKIYGIEPGAGANAMIKAMITKNQFGLGGFQLVESSESGMLSAVTRAVRRNEPIVFFGWAPHPMNFNYKMKYLSGSEGAMGKDEGKATVWTVVDPAFSEKCPNVTRLLDNLRFTADDESRMMEPLLAHEDPAKAANRWLDSHPEDVERWLEGVNRADGSPVN
ncbi:choline ABC transporter substrate-binding protein [Pseudomonas sp. CC120222-01a]|uniref:choline ABC transporter substrate-binding protein n=1 Tax=Pseudomonas sp. CC120222-01a TaxID=1378075 RepID=UPI000D9ECA42|nr:choline ABC transporter substrate-binding protein [Pseudomonas sp. CC120222-01a]PVZ42543.1 glycine betaine/proline transport system substrate-binding protein [Pseudomonas sp. CC120222-01a]